MLFRENLSRPSLSPSGSTRFPGGKTKLQRGNFTYRGGQSSWTTEQGFRSHSFKTEPQTKESSGRAIFVVKSIIPKYTPNTHYYMQERRRESLNHVSHDHLQRQTRGQCTSRRALRGSGVRWGAGRLCRSLALCRSHSRTHPCYSQTPLFSRGGESLAIRLLSKGPLPRPERAVSHRKDCLRLLELA